MRLWLLPLLGPRPSCDLQQETCVFGPRGRAGSPVVPWLSGSFGRGGAGSVLGLALVGLGRLYGLGVSLTLGLALGRACGALSQPRECSLGLALWWLWVCGWTWSAGLLGLWAVLGRGFPPFGRGSLCGSRVARLRPGGLQVWVWAGWSRGGPGGWGGVLVVGRAAGAGGWIARPLICILTRRLPPALGSCF